MKFNVRADKVGICTAILNTIGLIPHASGEDKLKAAQRVLEIVSPLFTAQAELGTLVYEFEKATAYASEVEYTVDELISLHGPGVLAVLAAVGLEEADEADSA